MDARTQAWHDEQLADENRRRALGMPSTIKAGTRYAPDRELAKKLGLEHEFNQLHGAEKTR